MGLRMRRFQKEGGGDGWGEVTRRAVYFFRKRRAEMGAEAGILKSSRRR
jgi:hypothetical protein